MKWITAWWGCEFVAETDNDVRILKELHKACGSKPTHSYEDGEMSIEQNINDETSWDYEPPEEPKLVLTVSR